MKLFLCISSLAALTTNTNAETLVFGLYTDNTCTVPKGISGDNPWTIDPETCFSWQRSNGPANSMQVLSCSSTCICYEQSPGSLLCDSQGNVKESCTNSCRPDAQGSYLQISDYNGCGALQVPDDQYFCPCTQMVDNGVCTSLSPNPAPTVNPTIVPLPPATVNEDLLCDVMNVYGQTFFLPAVGICWRVQLGVDGTVEGDFNDGDCSKNESDWQSTHGVFSIFDYVKPSDNTAVFIDGTNKYSGTFQFKEDSTVIKPSLYILGFNSNLKEFALEVTIPTCSADAICPTMKVVL